MIVNTLHEDELYDLESITIFASLKGIADRTCLEKAIIRKNVVEFWCKCSPNCKSHIFFAKDGNKYKITSESHAHDIPEELRTPCPNKFHFQHVIMEAIAKIPPKNRFCYVKNIFRNCILSDSKIKSALYRYDQSIDHDPLTSWQKIPSFLSHIEEQGFITNTLYDEQNPAQLNYIYLEMPYAKKICSHQTWTRTIFIDGAGIKYQTKGVLLAAVTASPSHMILPLSIAIVDVECKDSYHFFFDNMTFLRDVQIEYTIMADEFKAIESCITEILPILANYCPCAWHISQKIQANKEEFFDLLISDNLDLLQARIESFKENHKKAFKKFSKYLDILPVIKGPPRLNFLSNIIESFNNAIINSRRKHPIEILRFFINWSTESFNKFVSTLNRIDNYLVFAINSITEEEKRIKTYIVEENKDGGCFRVLKHFVDDITIRYTVSYENNFLKCSCAHNERVGLPCVHILSIINNNPELHLNKFAYISDIYKVDKLSEVYSPIGYALPENNDMVIDEDILLPPIPAMVGRRKGIKKYKYRRKEGAVPRVFKLCPICKKSRNHYPSKCPENPINKNRSDFLKEKEKRKEERNRRIALHLPEQNSSSDQEESHIDQDASIPELDETVSDQEESHIDQDASISVPTFEVPSIHSTKSNSERTRSKTNFKKETHIYSMASRTRSKSKIVTRSSKRKSKS